MHWNIPSLEELEDAIWRCTACGTCKVAYEYGPPSQLPGNLSLGDGIRL